MAGLRGAWFLDLVVGIASDAFRLFRLLGTLPGCLLAGMSGKDGGEGEAVPAVAHCSNLNTHERVFF